MTTKAQQEKEAAAEAAAAAALDEAVAELVATGMDPVAAAAQARAAAETPLAGPDDGGFTGPGTKEPDANPKEATAKRARRGRAVKDAADAVPNALTDAESRAATSRRCSSSRISAATIGRSPPPSTVRSISSPGPSVATSCGCRRRRVSRSCWAVAEP